MDFKNVKIIDIGESVVCDWCGDDWTNKDESGGLLFGSKACCPRCEPKVRKLAIRYGEEKYIKNECPKGMSFKQWVLRLRGGDNTIKIFT